MNLGRNTKSISFVGLFFLASISLHSFAHIDESPIEHYAEFECQSCHNDTSSDIELVKLISDEYFVKPRGFDNSNKLYLQSRKPFSSQAPPKIII